MTDRDWVQRTLVLDDRHAYGELVRKYQREIRAYLIRLTRNPERADDLAQETFLAGYRQLRQLDDGNRFRSWVYAIAHRQFLMSLRSRHEEGGADEGPEPSVGAESVTTRAELESVLATLRPEERSALVLCLGHEFSHTEAAGILSLPVGTVKSLILRARAKLEASHAQE